MTDKLVVKLRKIVPHLSSEDVLNFAFNELISSQELPVVFLVSAFLLEIWSRRVRRERITCYDIRTTVEARCSLLRETRYHPSFQIMQEILKDF